MQLDFEMENFTSQSVTRRIMWHIDYRGRNPPPDLEKAVTELTVIQRDIWAILPLAMVSDSLGQCPPKAAALTFSDTSCIPLHHCIFLT